MFGWLKKRPEVADRERLPGSKIEAQLDPERLREQADASLRAGELVEAERGYRAVLEQSPDDAKALVSLGFILLEQNNRDEAVTRLKRAAQIDLSGHDAHYMLGTLYESTGQEDLAAKHLELAVERAPDFELATRDLSRVLAKAGRTEAAEAALARGIVRNPSFADFHFYLGNISALNGKWPGAVESYSNAVAIEGANTSWRIALANALERAGSANEAILELQKAVEVDPTYAKARIAFGDILVRQGRLVDAASEFKRAVEIDPTDVDAGNNLGNVLVALNQPAEAVDVLLAALRLHPDAAGLHNNLGNAYLRLNRTNDAVSEYSRATELRPDLIDALVNLGHALTVLKRYTEAVATYQRAIGVNGEAVWLFGALLHTRMRICDWKSIETEFLELARRIDLGQRAAWPFAVLAAPLTAEQQQHCSSIYVQSLNLPDVQAPIPGPPKERIRIGYYSADFHGHATAYLMAELFERHDRARFEVVAFSFGPDSQHPMRSRLKAAFDEFIDVTRLSDAEIAKLSRDKKIDIAIDLKGFTEDARIGIFASRAAAVQVSFIGYPGTMGAPFIDYLVGDPIVTPVETAGAYTEKIVFLPDSYQSNDSKREVAVRTPKRGEVGLPEKAFVFCCFNNNYKITPDLFDVWMKLLTAVPGSVLWLLQDNQEAARNLREEALSRGISPVRLVFAPRVEMPDHLARHRLADLFLDTLYCNAHTTASDALWAGLPVLTCAGNTFASRVAASLLHAVGLEELVVETLDEYERVALALARQPDRLNELRQHLADNPSRLPLFDSELYTRHVESAYESMMQRQLAGLAPDHIHVARLTRA